ncbi:MAG: response regulator transcription factor [Gammaproteobacteria bacterium]|nr:response regulator transcription factor [Gammaproteobacteria bacterium]
MPVQRDPRGFDRDPYIRLLIADCEPRFRSALASLCQHSDGLRVVGEADSGIMAIKAADKLRPDVILLDTNFADMTGFEVLRAVRQKASPLAIMLSAVAPAPPPAHEAGVIDCLVKPIGARRFAESIARARERYRLNELRLPGQLTAASLRPPPAVREAALSPSGVLVGERERRLYILDPEKIEYVESHGNYVKFHVGDVEYISRNSVKQLASGLARCGFLRIQRSVLINIRAILYAQRDGRGTYAFTLVSGQCLHSGATYRSEILRALPLAQGPG